MLAPTDIIKQIFSIGKLIYDQAQLVKANQSQCQRLAERIQIVISAINLNDIQDSEHFRTALVHMQTTLDDCLKFITLFSQKNWFKKMLKAGSHKEDFERLNQAVCDAAQNLNLGLAAQQIMNREQDRADQKNDMDSLKAKQEQIIGLVEVGLKAQQQESHQIKAMRLERKEADKLLLKQLASVREKLTRLSVAAPSQKSILDPKFEIDYYDFEFEEILTQGNFGTVYAGRWQNTPVAIKAFSHSLNDTDYQQFIREAQIASRLLHPNIIQFLGACLEQERACLITEKIENSLYDAMAKSLLTDQPEAQKEIILDITRGLAYLHSQKILHRNLNGRSILLDRHNQAKLADFGFAKLDSSSVATLQNQITNNAYLAPEMFEYKQIYTDAADVYSLGMVIWEIVTGKLAFENFKGDLIAYMRSGGRETISATVPEFYVKLIQRCWHADPKQRPSVAEIILQVEKYIPRPSSPSPESLFQQAIQHEKDGNDAAAFKAYQSASGKGYFRASTNLATFFLQGRTIPSDKKKAFELLSKAAEAGYARAQHNLATMFSNGDGVDKDIKQAIFWYRKAAEQGDTRAGEKADLLEKTFSYRGNLTQTFQ